MKSFLKFSCKLFLGLLIFSNLIVLTGPDFTRPTIEDLYSMPYRGVPSQPNPNPPGKGHGFPIVTDEEHGDQGASNYLLPPATGENTILPLNTER